MCVRVWAGGCGCVRVRLRHKLKIQVYIRRISVSTNNNNKSLRILSVWRYCYVHRLFLRSVRCVHTWGGDIKGGGKGVRRVEETVICDKARLWPCTTAFVRPSSIFVRSSTRVASQSGPLLFVLVNFWISTSCNWLSGSATVATECRQTPNDKKEVNRDQDKVFS